MIAIPHPSDAEIEQCVALTHKVIHERLVSLGFIAGGEPIEPSRSDPLAKKLKKVSDQKDTSNMRPEVTDMTVSQQQLSKEERREWNIPRCVSDYINPKGHIIPLEIRAMSSKSQNIIPSNKHSEMSEYACKVSAKTQADIAALENEEEEKIVIENAMDEERLREIVRMNEEAHKELLQETEKSETKHERFERRQREQQLREHRRQIHHQELRKDRIRERFGIEDVSLERDIADTVALGSEHAGDKETHTDVFFDERLTKITLSEVNEADINLPTYMQWKNTEYSLNKKDVAGEVERMFAGTDGNANELVFENDEENPFADLDVHLKQNG